MRSLFLFLLGLGTLASCQSYDKQLSEKEWLTTFELSNGDSSASYQEAIAFYKRLSNYCPKVKVVSYGNTDSGYPLHLVLFNDEEKFSKEELSHKTVVLINNGIHPGESDGIDASLLLLKKLCFSKDPLYKNLVIGIIPVYNIGGALQRGAFSRANQNGPPEHGFRGNSQNLDLNRDFIKADSKEAQQFARIFSNWNPSVYIETHVSNGADYPYTMTYIASQADKLGGELGKLMREQLVPSFEKRMAALGDTTVPYVHGISHIPDSGLVCFLETPRYSSGYATLRNCLGFMTETHMLKPYKQRVESTLRALECLLSIANEQAPAIRAAREKTYQAQSTQTEFPIAWEIDYSQKDSLLFRGYKAEYKKSELSGLEQLSYNRSLPFWKWIPYFGKAKVSKSCLAPKGYWIPYAWEEVIKRLKINGVQIQTIGASTVQKAEVYYIKEYQTLSYPYEGHYLHHSLKIDKDTQEIRLHPNDYYISLDQPLKRFIIETLEPEASDSYFAWNYFDAILNQKEYFSDYVFEKTALELLEKDPALKQAFDNELKTNKDFAQNQQKQLEFIYYRSPYYEKSHKRYPVYRDLGLH